MVAAHQPNKPLPAESPSASAIPRHHRKAHKSPARRPLAKPCACVSFHPAKVSANCRVINLCPCVPSIAGDGLRRKHPASNGLLYRLSAKAAAHTSKMPALEPRL